MPDFHAILNDLAQAQLTPMELARIHGLSITELANAMAEPEPARAIENIAKLNAAHRRLLLDQVKSAAISTLTEIAADGGGVAAHATPAHSRMMETRRQACVDLLRLGESRPRQTTTRTDSVRPGYRPGVEHDHPADPALAQLKEARARAQRVSAAIAQRTSREREEAAAVMVAEIRAAQPGHKRAAEAEDDQAVTSPARNNRPTVQRASQQVETRDLTADQRPSRGHRARTVDPSQANDARKHLNPAVRARAPTFPSGRRSDQCSCYDRFCGTRDRALTLCVARRGGRVQAR